MSAARTPRLDRNLRRDRPIPRRAVLMAGCAGALQCAIAPFARAERAAFPPAEDGNRRFSVIYEGDRIGAHTVAYVASMGETRVSTEIHLLVKVAFFTMYRFSHRSEETWRAGQLMKLISETVEHGETLHVEGAATDQGFRVVNKGGPFVTSAATMTSNSLWSPAVLKQVTLVDAYHGGVIGVSARKLADERIMVAGREIATTRHAFITPYLAGSIWYDQQDFWVHGEFEIDGAKIRYQLDI